MIVPNSTTVADESKAGSTTAFEGDGGGKSQANPTSQRVRDIHL